MKKPLIFIVILLIIAVLAIGYINFSTKNNENNINKTSMLAKTFASEIQTPHPYPNSDSGRKVVWSYTINQPGVTFVGLFFKQFDVNGSIDIPESASTQRVDYGECNDTQVDKKLPCGVIEEVRDFTPQEIFDNNYVKGDFLVVKDKEGKVVSLLTNSYDVRPGSSTPVSGDTAIIELYADETGNGYGIYIDKYKIGLTDEESEQVNERLGQFLEECKKNNNGSEDCPTLSDFYKGLCVKENICG